MQIAKRVRRLTLEITEESYRELFVGSFVNYALLIATDARYHSILFVMPQELSAN